MRTSWLESLVAGAILFFASIPASAQPLFSSAESIECTVINADVVIVGKLVEIDGEGDGGLTATIEVEQTLKGEHRPRRRVRLDHHPASVLAKWKDDMSRLLLAAKEDSPADTSASVIDLAREDLAVLTADFTLLRKAGDVIRMAKEVVRRMPGVTRIGTFSLVVPHKTVAATNWAGDYQTGGYLTLEVPIDHRLEKRAHEFIHSDNYRRREAGAQALRYFKSDENIARVKTLLNDPDPTLLVPAGYNQGIEVRIYGVRNAAYQTLIYLGVKVERPTILEETVKLDRVLIADLSRRKVTEADLKELARFGNLQHLVLRNSEITNKALKQIARLKNLQELDLGGMKVTDVELKHLAGLINLKYLDLGGMKVTDAELKHLASLINLQYLDLGGTKITDVGLKQLAELKSLQKLDLERTQVTDDGVAELRKLRPDLKIQR